MTEKKRILKSASVISMITFVSRILGYVRDQRLALLLGTSHSADSFILAYSVPNLLRRLVGEGAMTASFIPVFTGYMAEKSKEEVWDFAQRLFWTLAVVLAFVTVLGVAFSPAFIHLLTLGSKGQVQWDEAIYLNRIAFPYVFFIGLAALAMAILNCFQVFGIPAATPILLNVAMITFSAGAVWKYFNSPALSIAAGVLVGGLLQFLVQVPFLVRQGMRFKFGVSFRDPGIRAVAKLMLPGFFGIGVAQINFFVNRLFATAAKMPRGSVTALYLSDRVMELVLGGYAIAVATAILPMMSHQAAAGDYDSVKRTLGFSLRIVSFITIPAAVGLMILRESIIRVLFEHGQFVAESTRLTARALLYSSAGLPAFAAVKLIVSAFYSARDTKTPVQVAAFTFVLNIVLNTLFLVAFFRVFQNGGPALATALAGYFNFVALIAIFRWRFGRLGSIEILSSMLKISVASAIMGVACWFADRYAQFTGQTRLFTQVPAIAGIILGAVALYLGVAWLLRCRELQEVYGIAVHGGQGAEAGYAGS